MWKAGSLEELDRVLKEIEEEEAAEKVQPRKPVTGRGTRRNSLTPQEA